MMIIRLLNICLGYKMSMVTTYNFNDENVYSLDKNICIKCVVYSFPCSDHYPYTVYMVTLNKVH